MKLQALSLGFRLESPDELYRKGAVGDWELYFTDDTKQSTGGN